MGKIIVVAGPSGCGKSTLIKRLMKEIPSLSFSVSHTTRPIRDGEEEGIDYHFIDGDKFQEMIEKKEFVEWANVHGKLYGTSFAELNRFEETSGKHLVLDIDVQGAMALKDRKQEAKYIFIKPPSIEELKKRLEKRQSENEESLKLRVWNAKREIEYAQQFDNVIVNDELEKAYSEFKTVIEDYINNNGDNENDNSTRETD